MVKGLMIINGRAKTKNCFHFFTTNLTDSLIFGGVYEGHNGSFAARYASQNLHRKILKNYSEYGLPTSIKLAFGLISGELCQRHDSAAAVAIFAIRGRELFYAHVGDCRMFLVNEICYEPLTLEHTIRVSQEKSAVESRQGKIEDGYIMKGTHGIRITRALGARIFNSVGVTSEPETGWRLLSPEKMFLVAATSQAYQTINNQEVTEILNASSNLTAGEKLISGKLASADDFALIALAI